jgi:DNA invertase Pin-like site-specific DNA recombinase
MKIAAAYGRYSSDRQSETSIETQIEKIEEYCIMNGYQLSYKFLDKALTASTDRRPEFLKAITEAKNRKFDALIVYKFDRFARNLEDAIVYSKMLEKYDVKLLSVNESLPEGPSGKLMYNIISSINDFYLENLSQEVKEKTLIVARKGYFVGGKTPYGFELVEVRDEYGKLRKKYVIKEDEAVHVRDMFRLYAEGSSLKYIAEKMRRKTERKWKASTIRDMLDNYKYGGYFTYNRGTQGKRHQEREDMIKIPDAIPRIVDPEIFEKVRQRFDGGRIVFRDRKYNYLLKGQAICGICGKELYGDGGKHPRYICPNAKHKVHEYLAITKKRIEDYAVGYLKNIVFKIDKINFDEYAIQINQEHERSNIVIDAKREKYSQRQLEIQKQKENIINAIKQGFASAELKDEMNNLDAEEKAIQEEINKLSENNELFITGEELKERFDIIRERLLSEDVMVLKQTLKAVIECIVVYPGGVMQIDIKEKFPLT